MSVPHPSQVRALLVQAANQFASMGVEIEDDCHLTGHMPWIAPRAFAFRIYEGLDNGLLPLSVPAEYEAVLNSMNGAFAFGFSLFGIPTASGLLNRTSLRPFSLEHANDDWRFEYKRGAELFHFGSAPLSSRENVGYFLSDRSVLALRKSGKAFGEWASISDMVANELPRTSLLFTQSPQNAKHFAECT